MADYASAVRSRFGTRFFDSNGDQIAIDPRPRMTPVLTERFDVGPGVFTPKASTGVNTGDVPVTNGSVHIYRANQVSVSGGNLVLTPVKEGSQWYSGYADTEGTYQVSGHFGIYVKFRLPYGFGNGAWPSGFGMFGQLHHNWPTNEELDGLPGEWVNDHPDRFYFTTHYDDPYGSGSSGHAAKPDYIHGAQNWISGFDPTVWHETLVIARPGMGFEWYLDGDLKFVTNGYNNAPTPRFTQPFRMILNYAIGSTNGFVSMPDGSSGTGTGDSNKYLVDTVEVYQVRPSQTFFGGIQYPSASVRADGGVIKLIKDDGSYLFPPTTGGGTGGGTTGGTGLPPAGTHALFSDTTSPTRKLIDWDAAVINNSALVTTSMFGTTGAPYVAIDDSGVRVYWTSSSTAGRLTVRSTIANPGTYTFVCPAGIQPSTSRGDHPIQLIQPDGSWIDIYGGPTGQSNITWSGNSGSWTVEGVRQMGVHTNGTGWPNPSTGAKYGFAACGATVAAGAITPEDKQLGYIAHALALVFGNNGLRQGPVLPAKSEDSGSSAYSGPFPQGALLAIPPTTRGGTAKPSGMSTMGSMIWDAFTNYGGYVMDRTGGFVIRAHSIQEPGVTATLSSADFSQIMNSASTSDGRRIAAALRWVTSAKGANHA